VIRLVRSATVALLVWVVAACSSSITPMRPRPPIPAPTPQAPQPLPEPPIVQAPEPSAPPIISPRSERADQPVRVALATGLDFARLSATGGIWALYDRTGENLIAEAQEGEIWTVERNGSGLSVSGSLGSPLFIQGPLVARPSESALLTYNGKRYRGELLVQATTTGLMVINRLSIETYLRGVVPLEIGVGRTWDEVAAVAAQAIAARSYTYTRLDENRPYDLTATVMDQVYGGVDAERPISDLAIEETRGLVLMYNGKVINAPYHSNSGGITASPSEVWRSKDEPYLVPVSDRIPGSDQFFCEDSPKFRWSRTYDAATLQSVLNQYLPKYTNAPKGSVGRILDIRESGRTASGRVATLVIKTEKGIYSLRGNDIRFVFRSSKGEILPSTLFTFKVDRTSGQVVRMTINGNGNGHGVGMDQWGAINRARAGQDYVTILRTYYPGTTIGTVHSLFEQ
jgi:stage II sporulation protein D